MAIIQLLGIAHYEGFFQFHVSARFVSGAMRGNVGPKKEESGAFFRSSAAF